MRLHFEADLDYQRDAIDAVCDLFRGQESYRGDFSVLANAAPGTTAAAQARSASRCRSKASATGCR
jgi:type III restriction enzyme